MIEKNVWQRLGKDKMLIWLDNDCERWVIQSLDPERIGKGLTKDEQIKYRGRCT